MSRRFCHNKKKYCAQKKVSYRYLFSFNAICREDLYGGEILCTDGSDADDDRIRSLVLKINGAEEQECNRLSLYLYKAEVPDKES